VAKKRPHHQLVALSPAEMKARVNRASQEGRFQQALDLAKQLYKAETNEPNRHLLQNIYLSRARQLRAQGSLKDVVTVLNVALQLGDSPAAWLSEVAQELANCGESQQAVNVLRLAGGDPQVEAKLLGKSMDRAVEQEARGRSGVPEEWQGDFDCVLKAFAQHEAGQDDAARETLQAIGLRSPFVEWKLLLRGLIAFSQSDDPRALENWQRLTPERLPGRLAAPYRLTIDQSFRLAQSPQAQAALQKTADQLLGHGLIPALRSVQKYLADEEQFAQAFRQVESILPLLRQSFPHLLPRLAACFYFSILHDGEPEDVPRYHRIFGAPKDDPKFDRLRAMALEQAGAFEEAHAAWQNYEKTIVADPTNWPGAPGEHARALIWLRMGRNAIIAESMEEEEDPFAPPWVESRPKKIVLNPSAPYCLEQSLKLVPGLLEAHQDSFHFYRAHQQLEKARAAATKLLQHFPNHLETLVELGELLQAQQEHIEAVKTYERALRINPLDRRLRSRLGTAHLFAARTHAEAGELDQARVGYQAAIALNDPAEPMLGQVYCKWAACEFKAGDAKRAEELLTKARAQNVSGLALAFSMLIEAIRCKLPRALKNRFDAEFKTGLGEPPTADAAFTLALTAVTHQRSGVKYPGQKAHEKLVLAYIEKASKLPFTETQFEAICDALVELAPKRTVDQFITLAQRRFPNNPWLLLHEVRSLMKQRGHRQKGWQIQPLLERALDLAQRQQLQDDRQKALIILIQKLLKEVESWNPFARLFGSMGTNPFFGGRSGIDEDETDEDDSSW
jgi:tetratricopeptide (TPR) repeat protein